jgi:hypothetical protein
MVVINQKVIICGVVKNAEEFIKTSIGICINTGELFEDYRIIVYENNSTDKTKEILNSLKDGSCKNKLRVISETIDNETIKRSSKIWAYTKITGSDHPCRMEQIANARNKLLEEIKKPDYNNFSYIIMIDLDTNYLDTNGIIDSFNNHKLESWDVIYANGIDKYGYYYDKYALRCHSNLFLFGAELYGDDFYLRRNNTIIKFEEDEKLVSVLSAFGGIGIYKKEVFNECYYQSLIDKSIVDFYSNLLSNLPEGAIPIDLMNLFEKPCNKFSGGFVSNYRNNHTGEMKHLYWKKCNGYNQPCLCEHVYLNINLVKRGYKIFINPKLYYLHS